MALLYYLLAVLFGTMGVAALTRVVAAVALEGGAALEPMQLMLCVAFFAVAAKSYRKARTVAVGRTFAGWSR